MLKSASSLVALCLFAVPAVAIAQPAPKSEPAKLPPTAADYEYGQDSERQKFDFWQAASDKPTPVVLMIHGGGWRGGLA